MRRATILRISGDLATCRTFATEICALAVSMHLKIDEDDSPEAILSTRRVFLVAGDGATARIFVEEIRALAVSVKIKLESDEMEPGKDSELYEEERQKREIVRAALVAKIEKKKSEALDRRHANIARGRRPAASPVVAATDPAPPITSRSTAPAE